MSVIVKDEDNRIRLICKGADSIVTGILSEESKNSDLFKLTQDQVDEWADEGLRTLFIAERIIPVSEFDHWFKKVEEARLLTVGREKALEALNNEIEIDLTLTGSTAIEDRLQDEVADSIRFMKRTGIKVWVLTGDKIGTAINIGLSAGLLDKESMMDRYLIDGKDESNGQEVIDKEA